MGYLQNICVFLILRWTVPLISNCFNFFLFYIRLQIIKQRRSSAKSFDKNFSTSNVWWKSLTKVSVSVSSKSKQPRNNKHKTSMFFTLLLLELWDSLSLKPTVVTGSQHLMFTTGFSCSCRSVGLEPRMRPFKMSCVHLAFQCEFVFLCRMLMVSDECFLYRRY